MIATVYTQKGNTINGRKVWLYLISSPIGNIIVVDYEQPTKEIVRKIFDEHYGQAEKYFDSICRKMIGGKI